MTRLTPQLARAGTDATPPALGGRRVWAAPAVASHAWLVLTPARLYLLPANYDRSEAVRHAVDAGADLEALFGGAATRLPLADLAGVEFRLRDTAMTLTHPAGRVEIAFADAEAADDFFTRLLGRTRDFLALASDRPDPLVAARTPLGLLAGVLLATATLAVTVSATEDVTVPGAPAWVVRWLALLSALDWRAVCAAGGAVAAWLQVAAYRAYHRPPSRLALVSVSPDARRGLAR
jgi:hypothetical protein